MKMLGRSISKTSTKRKRTSTFSTRRSTVCAVLSMHDNGYWLAVVLVYVALKEVQISKIIR